MLYCLVAGALVYIMVYACVCSAVTLGWASKCKYFQVPSNVNEPRHEKTVFFAYAKTKDADQLRSNCAADQRLCFRHTDSTIPLLPKSEISSVPVQPGLCRTWSETPKTGFLRTRLKCFYVPSNVNASMCHQT